MPDCVIMKEQGEASASSIRRHGIDHLGRTCLDEILYYYDLMPHARRYVCRAAWLYSECLRSIGDNYSPLLDKAVQVFNEFSPSDPRTAYSLTETDALSLVSYDYLF